jgi:phage-related minor tail protein
MASRIKGVTVEIGGDTNGLQIALKEAISATSEKQESLKTAQEQAKQQMENYDIGSHKCYIEAIFISAIKGVVK